MPLVADRVQESTTTTGTGSVTLGGAASGYRSFASAVKSGATVCYAIASTSEWEVGIGIFTAPTTLSRNTVLSSSNGGALVSFSAGSKDVFCTLPAALAGGKSLVAPQMPTVLVPSDTAAGDRFGISVALSADGNVLVVGAGSWEGSANDQGGVYTFDWTGSGWTQRGAVLTASDATASARYGVTVALSADGKTLVVGSDMRAGPEGSEQGGVYTYDLAGSTWVQRGSVLLASDAAAQDHFGRGVALSADGSVLAVGAEWWESGALTNQGGVYVYDVSGSSWVQRGSVLAAGDAAASDSYGTSVALSANGEILAVGAPTWEIAGLSGQGGVYIYDRNGASWTQRGAVIAPSDAASLDYLGSGVALSADGSVLYAGAYSWEGGFADQGGVYVFDWTGTAWVQRGSVITASDAASTDYFGLSVACDASGEKFVAGGYGWESAALTDQGGVYTFNPENRKTALLDFGAFPGSNEASVTITGQSLIDADSVPMAWVSAGDSTYDHIANDHRYFAALCSLTCGAPTAGSGFTIYASSAEKLQGKFIVRWDWK